MLGELGVGESVPCFGALAPRKPEPAPELGAGRPEGPAATSGWRPRRKGTGHAVPTTWADYVVWSGDTDEEQRADRKAALVVRSAHHVDFESGEVAWSKDKRPLVSRWSVTK